MSALKLANSSYGFTSTFASIINKSFQEGVFPEQMKTARVTPIHKEGSKVNVENYRPISILCSFSKIYEKLMHIRISNFLESNNSIYECQYGFRSGRSCEQALLNAQNILLESLSKQQISLLLLIDFSKAFDMVDHSILLNKLEHYGIRGIAHKWMESYLSNRKQFVSINGSDSEKLTMNYGVPQGSILGPLLFVIYINDIPEIAQYAKFILYADDANIILTAATIEEINTKLKTLTRVLQEWVNSNGLALNLKKTKYMIFSRARNIDLPEPLVISETPIERKHEARFLGVIMDESLNWSKHINAVHTKMSRYIGLMYKIKKFLPLQVRLQIYHSFVQSYVNYCSLVWGFSNKSNLEKLFAKQKQALRAVIPGYINYKYKDGKIPGHTKDKFSEYNILTIQNIVALNAFIFMHKAQCYPSLLPQSIRETIPRDSPIAGSTHETCENWLKKYSNFNYAKSLFYKGPLLLSGTQIMGHLPLTSFLSIKTFKTNVKKESLSRQSSGETCEWHHNNFVIYNIDGLRKSQASYRVNVDYNFQYIFD